MSDPAPRTPLKRWRIARALVMAFLTMKLAGWSPMNDTAVRSALAALGMAAAFLLSLRFERWIQDKREEAERPPDP